MALTHAHKQFLHKSTASLEEAASNIDTVRLELQESFDDLSDAAQEDQKGIDLTALIEHLEEGHDNIQGIINDLYELTTPPTPKAKK